MFETEKNIDAVIVGTPDHNHATATMWAMKHGKHVYCEKPLTYSIWEARQIAKAAKQAGVTTQMGNQGHSGEGIRLTVEWIKAGAIGDVREVHSWARNAGRRGTMPTERPQETPPVPDGLDWDLWIGPRPKRPYHRYYHPGSWRAWWDFGNSTIGDFACHNADPAFWALDLGHPDTVEATSSNFSDEVAPIAAMYTYKFPARGKMPPVTLTWYAGGVLPPIPDELEEGRKLTGDGYGILFVGDKGKIMCDGWGGSPEIIGESLRKDFKRPPKTLPRTSGDHMKDWVDACKEGRKSCADFEYSAHLTEVVLLGNVALRTGEKLRWDGENMKAVNCPDAEKYINPGYHNGWTL
jgi:predicted dehydrogenase